MHHNLKNFHKVVKTIKDHLHRHPLVKFLAVFLILLIYVITTIHQFGVKDGFVIGILTWTFFVLCTPIADAGFLLDFPIRILTGLRMMYSEIVVWSIAIVVNLLLFFSNAAMYQSTKLLSLFYHILAQPFPFWLIIILSGAGTFLSRVFGDEIIDISYEHKTDKTHHNKHKHKHHLIILITLFILILALYDFLLHKLGVSIPLH